MRSVLHYLSSLSVLLGYSIVELVAIIRGREICGHIQPRKELWVHRWIMTRTKIPHQWRTLFRVEFLPMDTVVVQYQQILMRPRLAAAMMPLRVNRALDGALSDTLFTVNPHRLHVYAILTPKSQETRS